jgi:hypothetical protein
MFSRLIFEPKKAARRMAVAMGFKSALRLRGGRAICKADAELRAVCGSKCGAPLKTAPYS